MKSFVTLLALAASVSAEAWGPPQDRRLPACGAPAAPSCKRLSAKVTKDCAKSIERQWIDIRTCATPSSTSTVTVTKTARERNWPTTTVEVLSTWTSTAHFNTTVTSTEVTTLSTTLTQTESTEVFSTITNTEHLNITSTQTISETTTTTATVTTNPLQETCKAKRAAEPIEKRGRNDLPADCSCFLTSTTASGVATTTTTTTVTPTVTVTTTNRVKQVLSTTWIITALATSTTVEEIPETVTETSTALVTEVNSITWTLSASSTTTVVTTATDYAQADVCATFTPNPSAISSPNTRPDVSSARDFKDCCRQCFGKKNCVFFDFIPTGNVCKIFPNTRNKQCITDNCPKGKADVSLSRLGRNERDQYGIGPCATW